MMQVFLTNNLMSEKNPHKNVLIISHIKILIDQMFNTEIQLRAF